MNFRMNLAVLIIMALPAAGCVSTSVLVEEKLDMGTGVTVTHATAPIVLQKAQYLVDLLGCWYDGGGVGGSRLLLRVRS